LTGGRSAPVSVVLRSDRRGPRNGSRIWLFDLDNTLHDASGATFGPLNQAMTDFIAAALSLTHEEADHLRRHYWQRYGATLLGLARHHGVAPAHFLHHTHQLPGLEKRLRGSCADRAALARLPGRKIVLTNAPLAYARRVLDVLRIAHHFEAVVSIERMHMFGHLRPKPDTRMLRFVCARLRARPSHCVLVEDTLEHQRAAWSVGMRTVWMRRYTRSAEAITITPKVGVHPCGRPPYVYARISALRFLRAL
jgi:putative hydrolase of the HAD superfamily